METQGRTGQKTIMQSTFREGPRDHPEGKDLYFFLLPSLRAVPFFVIQLISTKDFFKEGKNLCKNCETAELHDCHLFQCGVLCVRNDDF